MKLNGFWFAILFTLSLLFVAWSFDYADSQRVIKGTGGEVFTLLLPFAILRWRVWTVGEKIKKETQDENNTQQ